MALFRVNLDYDFVVKADSEEEAIELASRQIEEIVRNDVIDEEFTLVCQIKSAKDLPPGWSSPYCVPWGQNVKPSYSMLDEINADFEPNKEET